MKRLQLTALTFIESAYSVRALSTRCIQYPAKINVLPPNTTVLHRVIVSNFTINGGLKAFLIAHSSYNFIKVPLVSFSCALNSSARLVGGKQNTVFLL